MKNKFVKPTVITLAIILVFGGLIWFMTKPIRTYPPVSALIGEAFNRGDFDRAITLSNEVLQKNPQDVNAILFLSQIYAQKGSLEFKEKEFGQKAIDYANQALAIDSNNSQAYIALGYAHEIMQKYEASLTAYNKAITLNKSNALSYVHRGHVYDLLGDLAKAREDYLKAAALEPNNPQVAQNLGRLYARLGDLSKAKDNFLIVASSSENIRLKAEANYNLSTIAFFSSSTKAVDESLAYASSSLAIDPSYPQAYFAVGRAYVAKKDFSEAAIMLDKALKLYPNLTGAFEWRANLYAELGKKYEAINAFEDQKKSALLDIGLMENERNKVISNSALNQAVLFAQLNQKEKVLAALEESIDKADALGLLVIKYMLEDAATNEFKDLTNYQPIKDLIKKINNKVQVEMIKLKKDKPLNFFEEVKRFLGFFSPEKAYAMTDSCGSYNGANVTWNDNGGISMRPAAKTLCAVLLAHLQGDDTRWDEVLLAIEAIRAYLADPDAEGGFYTDYQGITGAMYLGCANGVGATYIPVASGLSPNGVLSCGTSAVTLTWSAVSGADYYDIRVDDTTANGWGGKSGGSGVCSGYSGGGDLCENSLTGTSRSNYPVTTGHSYSFWVDAYDQVYVPKVDAYYVPPSSCHAGYYDYPALQRGWHDPWCDVSGYWVPEVPAHYNYVKLSTRYSYFNSPNCSPGVCGSANGAYFANKPTTNLCSYGLASTVSGSGPWLWTCAGSYGGATSPQCSANKIPEPTNVTLSCPSPGTTATISWTAPSGYNTFDWRANPVPPGGPTLPFSFGASNYVGTSVTFSSSTLPGKSYIAWVHTNRSGTESNAGVSNTVVCVPPTFSATCSAVPSSGNAPLNVIWTAVPSGGVSPYTYSWVFTDGSTSALSSVSKIYSSVGTYHATTTVTDSNNSSITISCPGTIISGTGCVGSCGDGIVVTTPTDGVCGVTPDTCLVGNPSYVADTPTHYLWDCTGLNQGNTVSCQSAISTTSFDCSVSLSTEPDTLNQVPVNTNTVWVLNRGASTSTAGYDVNWEITDNGVTTPTTEHNDTLNHIFSTVGLKTVGVYFSTSSSPGSLWYCANNASVATTSVVLPGSLNEI